ncbi:hypothetical protein O3M35_003014 [Rhynocoris fuscipes]|uniref:UDP-glucuronosyltransferase n=1 Tax=Rhynocoris fuscipes TaxID=488301 RepID=A0AAW1CIN6_9HEMI
MFGIIEIGIELSRSALKTEPLRKLISDKDSKYDVVITETGLFHEPFVAFGHKFNATIIDISSVFLFPRSAYVTGNHMPTTYVPVGFYFSFHDRMTFVERVKNTFLYYWDVFYAKLYYYKKQDALMREHFIYPGSENIPDLEYMISNTALTLMEHDLAVGYPVPLHKNVVQVSGVGLKTPDPLPQDLQKFMDESKNGVIYFSFGSLFNITSLRPETQQAIINALSTFTKYKNVLMKINDENLGAKLSSKNFVIKPWFPQRSILAHPNCDLFITHGGLHGTMEGFYHGVPMVVMPVVSDQLYNAKIIETHGLGLSLDSQSITEQQLIDTINEVLKNPKYRENARKRSAIFKDKPISPMDNAIYWIEYVIRHKGAPHLRPAVLDLYWYQRLMLDVIVFYLFISAILIFILYLILKLFHRCLCILISSLFFRDNQTKFKKL